MSGNVIQVSPLSRLQIRELANAVRKINAELTGKNDEAFFPILEFLDITLPKYVSEFVLRFCEDDELDGALGMTYPERDLILIHQKVGRGAKNHNGFDRMTMAHELGHYVMHSNVGFARVTPAHEIPAYRSSEWQANAFGGELLVSAEHVNQCKSAKEVALLFGVSLEAANYQWNIFKSEGLIKKAV